MNDLTDDEWTETRTLFEQTAPYLMNKGAMSDVLLAGGKLHPLDMPPGSDQSRLLADPVLLEMVTWRINSLENLLLEVQDVEDATNRIVEMLQSSQATE